MKENLSLVIKIAWLSILWHINHPEGYCDGWNWQTCKEIPNKDCIWIKNNIHCGNCIHYRTFS